MRTISFILACAFVVAGPSMTGPSDHGLPGIGSFAYSGPTMAGYLPREMVVAAK